MEAEASQEASWAGAQVGLLGTVCTSPNTHTPLHTSFVPPNTTSLPPPAGVLLPAAATSPHAADANTVTYEQCPGVSLGQKQPNIYGTLLCKQPMFSPPSSLPAVYEAFPPEAYADEVMASPPPQVQG